MKYSRLYRLNSDYMGTLSPWVTRGLGRQVLVKPVAQRSDHTGKVKSNTEEDQNGSKGWNANILNAET